MWIRLAWEASRVASNTKIWYHMDRIIQSSNILERVMIDPSIN